MEYINEASIIAFNQAAPLEISYFDSEKCVLFVKRSTDHGETWVTLREYDSKEWIIKA